jgi:hypothetical protein
MINVFKKKKSNHKIYLTQGMHLGVHMWHYVRVDLLKLPLFQKALQSGTVDVAHYGKVLYSGFGMNPPDSIRKKIDELYA